MLILAPLLLHRYSEKELHTGCLGERRKMLSGSKMLDHRASQFRNFALLSVLVTLICFLVTQMLLLKAKKIFWLRLFPLLNHSVSAQFPSKYE